MTVRILIVEDEQIIAADLSNKLARMGHDVVGFAIAGEDAVTMADQLRPDLVMMDVQLEGTLNGIDAAQTIQRRTGAQVIFVTAYPGVFLRDPKRMGRPGICLGKPFSRLQLEAALSAALGRSMSTGDFGGKPS